MVKTILLRGGSTAEHETFVGAEREITVDTTKKTLVVHDGATGHPVARKSDLPTKLSDLTDGIGLWKKSVLTKVSQLTDDVGYWANLIKVSQLQNDLNWKTGHCSYCTHCTYCTQCSRCNNVQCNQVHCNQVKCSDCSQCPTIQCHCDCDCTDDSCFISGKLETNRGLTDVHDIRVGDEIIDWLGKPIKVAGVSHGHLGSRRAIQIKGCGVNRVTDDHPMLIFRTKRRSYELCACINSKFDPNKIILADNGIRGRYSEENDYCGWFIPTIEMPADTPTVCPIAEREAVVKFGNGYVLVPGQINKE